MQPSYQKIRKALLKKENDIVRENKLYCIGTGIEWTKDHDECLRLALRKFFVEGFYAIAKDLYYAEPPQK
jgi:hypothetical protein